MSQDSRAPLVEDMKSIATATQAQIESSTHPSYDHAGSRANAPGLSQSSGISDKRTEFRQRVGVKGETGASPLMLSFTLQRPCNKDADVNKRLLQSSLKQRLKLNRKNADNSSGDLTRPTFVYSYANYLDLWVSVDKLIKPTDADKNPSTQLKDVSPAAISEQKPSSEESLLKTRP
ncbi:hypothetical protein Z517_12504 [Fonsecaea pedrosoi CBS 271.37]|uniref:Uncharacterized protein n=1 Tax=Fonsecaea pedrosoi CBS 271.37 TaxID=1442368 RepID=A0A0D2GNX5_9EURO|nr:uncharacterized protein Z517_12504 [Fonsecaea pedrosoi CBS 271.37]KIW74094.1 hypothetical protein Z517_12504 [Fonsecaea pedrosoi CBS 271.37]